MRAVITSVAALLLGCDAGVPPEKPAPSPPRPIPTVPADAAVAEPAAPHEIEWELGGLASWKGKVVGGLLWHVRIDLATAHIEITNPDGTTQRTLAPDRVREYARLARAVRDEPHRRAQNSCTDRSETLRVDVLSISDSCPIADPAAAALIAAIDHELK